MALPAQTFTTLSQLRWHGLRKPLCGASPGDRWEHSTGQTYAGGAYLGIAGTPAAHRLQNHPDAAPLTTATITSAPSKRLVMATAPITWASAVHQWEPLWDNRVGRRGLREPIVAGIRARPWQYLPHSCDVPRPAVVVGKTEIARFQGPHCRRRLRPSQTGSRTDGLSSRITMTGRESV